MLRKKCIFKIGFNSRSFFCELKVPETEDDESTNQSEFNEFSKLLLNGQRVADDTGKSYTFVWRGYKACVSSKLGKLTTHELRRRFQLAMKFISEDDGQFKKPNTPSQSTFSEEPSITFKSTQVEELSQIPATQFEMEGTNAVNIAIWPANQ